VSEDVIDDEVLVVEVEVVGRPEIVIARVLFPGGGELGGENVPVLLGLV
jgi:hypothetical protein